MIPQRVRLLVAAAATGLALIQPLQARHVPADEELPREDAGIPIESLPSTSALECQLLRDASDGQWDKHDLFGAALVASGVTTGAELEAQIDHFARLAEELRAGLSGLRTAEDRASFALVFLHRRVLHGGYDLQATELPLVFASGRFNCVSVTVLYNSLAAQADLRLAALRLPHHTCSLLLDGQQRTRVEATCTDWFTARHPPRTVAGAETRQAPPTGEESGGGEGRQISDVALVAMIYYNRGVEALRQGDYAQAISLNRRALWLDPHSSDARGNLLTAMNKQALSLASRADFSGALAVVDQGLAIDPNHSTLRHNRLYINRARQEAAANESADTL